MRPASWVPLPHSYSLDGQQSPALPPARRHRAGGEPGAYPEIAGGGRTGGGEAMPDRGGSPPELWEAVRSRHLPRGCEEPPGTARGGCYHKTDKCYHGCVRQLITRLDDDLHARLRERAAAEGRSVNALVVEILAAAVAPAIDGKGFDGGRRRQDGWWCPYGRTAPLPGRRWRRPRAGPGRR